jgi:hypothetical protein
VQVLSIVPQEVELDRDEPWSADEFNALVTAMCGRYVAMRQAIEEMADDQLRELRQLMKARQA